MRGAVIIALAALFMTLAPVAVNLAWSQQMACAPSKELFPKIKAQYGEDPIYHGTTQAGGLVTVTANFSTGTWSILAEMDYQGTRMACIMSAGDGGAVLAPSLKGDPS